MKYCNFYSRNFRIIELVIFNLIGSIFNTKTRKICPIKAQQIQEIFLLYKVVRYLSSRKLYLTNEPIKFFTLGNLRLGPEIVLGYFKIKVFELFMALLMTRRADIKHSCKVATILKLLNSYCRQRMFEYPCLSRPDW